MHTHDSPLHPLGGLPVLLLGGLVLALFAPIPARAQAGLSPLSTAKLRIPSADPVPEGRLELGLHYQMGWSRRVYTEEGRVERIRPTLPIPQVRVLFFGFQIGLDARRLVRDAGAYFLFSNGRFLKTL